MNYYETLRDFVQREKIEGKHAIFFKGRATTYQELLEGANRTAGALNSECGVNKGQAVGLYMNNCVDYISCFLGIAKLGAICLPINPVLTRYEIQPMLKISKAQTIIVSPQFLPTVEAMRPNLPNLKQVIVKSEECPPGTLSYFELLKRAEPLPESEMKGDSNDPMLILFTAGTTGLPKGVPLTHRNLLTIVEGSRARHAPLGELIALEPIPLSHIFGLHSITLCSLFQKSPVVIMERWDGAEGAKLVETHRVSYMYIVPTIIIDLLNYADKYDLSSLRVLINGGAPISAALAERVKQTLNISLGNGE